MRRLLPTRGRLKELWHQHVAKDPWIFRDRYGLLYLFEQGDNVAWYCDQGVVLDDHAQLAYLQRAIQPGMVVLDVGSNIGGVSLLAAKLLQGTGQLYAFEADPGTYRLLSINFALNSVPTNFRAIHCAVTSAPGIASLSVFPRKVSGWNTLGHFELGGYRPERLVEVPATTLDVFAAENAVGKIDLIKVDVEGAEPEVFAGAADLLRRHVPSNVLFEISTIPLKGMRHTIAEVIEPLLGFDYRIFALNTDGTTRPADRGEIEKTTFGNFLAKAPGVP